MSIASLDRLTPNSGAANVEHVVRSRTRTLGEIACAAYWEAVCLSMGQNPGQAKHGGEIHKPFGAELFQFEHVAKVIEIEVMRRYDLGYPVMDSSTPPDEKIDCERAANGCEPMKDKGESNAAR